MSYNNLAIFGWPRVPEHISVRYDGGDTIFVEQHTCHLKYDDNNINAPICSYCNTPIDEDGYDKYMYCPYCGAKIERG